MKRILAMMLCFVMCATVFTGCKIDAKQNIKKAVDKMSKASSLQIDGSVTGTMEFDVGDTKQTFDLSTKTQEVCFADPYKAKVNAVVKSPTEKKIDAYIEKEGDNYVVYQGYQGAWLRQTVADPNTLLQTSTSQIGVLDNIFQGNDVQMEKLDNQKEGNVLYQVYRLSVDLEKAQNMVEGMTSSYTSSFGTISDEDMKEIIQEVIGETQSFQWTLWYDNAKKEIYKIQFSMGEIMQKVMTKYLDKIARQAEKKAGENAMTLQDVLKDITISVDKMDVELIFTNYDSAPDFTIPEEVKKVTAVESGSAETK